MKPENEQKLQRAANEVREQCTCTQEHQCVFCATAGTIYGVIKDERLKPTLKKKVVKRYGANAANKGELEDVTKCIKQIWSENGFKSWQCKRKRGHGPEGLYCKQHGKRIEQLDDLHIMTLTSNFPR